MAWQERNVGRYLVYLGSALASPLLAADRVAA